MSADGSGARIFANRPPCVIIINRSHCFRHDGSVDRVWSSESFRCKKGRDPQRRASTWFWLWQACRCLPSTASATAIIPTTRSVAAVLLGSSGPAAGLGATIAGRACRQSGKVGPFIRGKGAPTFGGFPSRGLAIDPFGPGSTYAIPGRAATADQGPGCVSEQSLALGILISIEAEKSFSTLPRKRGRGSGPHRRAIAP